jgi:hypothetical protein
MQFKLQSYNPVSHVVININTTAIVFRSEELWRCTIICDLLNQIEFCNNRIAALGAANMPKHQWQFVTEYYRVTRGQALNAAAIIGGEFPIKYCCECLDGGKNVQAVHVHQTPSGPAAYCDFHKTQLKLLTERIW